MNTAIRCTIAEYDAMIREGVFDRGPSRRVELIHGEIREMSPIGAEHEDVLQILLDWSYDNAPRDRIKIRPQESLELTLQASVPEPDLTWVQRKDYRQNRPAAADVFLLIEIAASSLASDCGDKAELYSAAGIADYWVVNLVDQQVEVFRDPRNGSYAAHTAHDLASTVSPLDFPEISLPVARLFRKA